jgi:hypothetical protein
VVPSDRLLDDRFHKTDHNSTFVESDQARISQGHLTTSVPANIRFEPRKRPTRNYVRYTDKFQAGVVKYPTSGTVRSRNTKPKVRTSE